MEELLQAQLNAQRAGVSYAVVTIAEASGSVPRTSGKMLVYADGHSLGTIGGGPAERRAKADALAQLDAGQNAFLHYDFPTPGGASCAGRLSILIEVFQPKPLLVVLAAGMWGRVFCASPRRRVFARCCSTTAPGTRFRTPSRLQAALSAYKTWSAIS